MITRALHCSVVLEEGYQLWCLLTWRSPPRHTGVLQLRRKGIILAHVITLPEQLVLP